VTDTRALLPVLTCALLLMTGCAEHAAPGAPVETRAGIPPIVELQPMPDPVPVPPVPDALLLEGVTPMPAELLDFQDRLHELAGDSPDLGTGSVEDGYAHVVVRWYGDPPAEVLALVEEYAHAPFEIRVQRTQFRQGDLSEEAGRLVREYPGVVTGAGPRTEGDGVTGGIDPAVAADPGPDDLADLGVTSRFPLFPEAMGQAVPAGG
jgi:hypothetical protein